MIYHTVVREAVEEVTVGGEGTAAESSGESGLGGPGPGTVRTTATNSTNSTEPGKGAGESGKGVGRKSKKIVMVRSSYARMTLTGELVPLHYYQWMLYLHIAIVTFLVIFIGGVAGGAQKTNWMGVL